MQGDQRSEDQGMLGRVSRRDLVRRAALLGLSAPAAGAILAANPASALAGSSGVRGGTATRLIQEANAGNFTIEVASGADPVSLDPRKTFVGPGYSINAHAFEAVAFRRELEGGQIELYPVLAESWEQIDPTTLQLKIRQGVKFHNGEDLDANAVAFTYTSIMDPEFTTSLKTWVSDIESVEATDASTVVVKTKYQVRGLLNSLAQMPIVAPKAAQEQGADFEKQPVGTGPYRIVSYNPNSTVVMERFDDYWGEPGKAQGITFRILPENSARIAALEAGEVQLAEALPPDKLESLQSNENIEVLFTPTMRVDFLVPNFKTPIMQDLKFRQAMSFAIDRESLVENLLAGTTKAANSISPPGTIGYDETLPVYEYNVEKAKQALAESAYDGQEIKMGGPVGRYSMDKQVSEAIAGMLGEVGINVNLETLEWASFSGKREEGAYDLFFIGITDFTLNPPKHWGMFDSARSSIYGFYSNPEMDAIIQEGAQTLDDEKAAEIFKRGQQFQHQDLGSLPLYYEPQLIGINTQLQGFRPRLDEYVIVTEATIAE